LTFTLEYIQAHQNHCNF